MVDGRTEVDDERIVCSNVLVLFVFVCVRSRRRSGRVDATIWFVVSDGAATATANERDCTT